MSFAAKVPALPAPQRALWPELKQVPRRFVLYGGTALALRLGHRESVDFDFFANAPVYPDELLRSLPVLKDATVRQLAPNTLTVVVHRPEPVKLSFFGLTLGRVRDPEWTEDGAVRVASLLDIAACKMAVIQQRAESRDYLDIQALLHNGIALAEALGAAQAVYGAQFNPMISLKALTSFVDGDLSGLSSALQNELRQAAAAVREIPTFQPLPGGLVPDGE
ncbi:MAG: nucleotidyl transferase AbiEii/AbiGii toxin family protein [Verrucomicrobia bacterium]|nr:nucleotidyl transferase AbiEii/AbiGii toxin family protein [Verrucomicrobiota bacterium]